MGFNIKHINKYIRWLKKHSAEYRDNKYWSKEYAKYCGDLDWGLLLQKSNDKLDYLAMRKHEYILDFMSRTCSETISKYQNFPTPQNLHELNKETKVWSMWWQGEDQADKLFRMCIDSARRHTGQNIITLSKDNYSQYFDIPDYILRKHKEGKIALQHICDFMVMSIMAEQGGFFTGATVWWSQDKDENFLRTPFFVCKAETDRKLFMSRSRWVGYVMGGNKEFPLFPFVRDCLKEYWLKCDKAIDYLMMDYIFELAYRNIPCVRETINENPDNNMLRNDLIGNLGEPYDEERFKYYTEGDTFLYKLSWKFGSKDLKTSDGRITNYGHMIEECGDRI